MQELGAYDEPDGNLMKWFLQEYYVLYLTARQKYIAKNFAV